MEPRFRKRADGSLKLSNSKAAVAVKEENEQMPCSSTISPEKTVLQSGVDTSQAVHILGQQELQFGDFQGKTFKWVAENALGYAGRLIADMTKESSDEDDCSNHAENKRAFRTYIEHFPEGRCAVQIKLEDMSDESTQPATQTSTQTFTSSVNSHLSSGLVHSSTTSVPSPVTASFMCRQVSDYKLMQKVCVPAGWKSALPLVDQQWIARALFRWSHCWKPELDLSVVNRMWWYPAQPSLAQTGMPAIERYFGHALFLWMPSALWRVQLFCPHPDCDKEELTYAGVHQSVRQVVGVCSSYFIATECLICTSCKRKVISWSQDIISQLDIGYSVQFPCVLTSKLACDVQVVREIRQSGLWNCSSRIQKQLEERHLEVWLQKQIQYLSDCRELLRDASYEEITPDALEDPPELLSVPKHSWLKQVYVQDVLNRLDELKASITSQFGRILKIDLTKINVRKIVGQSDSTAIWATNIGNEHEQVIMSVLTESEGCDLGKMTAGIVKRYKDAGVSPPKVLYADRDCCGSSHLRNMFRSWPDVKIRLDVWHFMRRIAAGCTTDTHVLYTGFMNHLAHCIFMWDKRDLQALKEAKWSELEARLDPTETDIMRHITRAEMALHCRRSIRSCTEIEALVTELIEVYDCEKGHNALGAPLINSARMAKIWKEQRQHVACIQDPPGVQLYVQTGTVVKGGHTLPTYRCARGCTSLKSFHLHMSRFIPKTQESDTIFQAYLVDGITRWNESRSMAAIRRVDSHSCSSLLKNAANQLAQELLGRNLVDYKAPRKYTGELIGVEYLYERADITLEDYKLSISALETEDVPMAEDEALMKTQDFEDLTVPMLETATFPVLSSAVSLNPNSALHSILTVPTSHSCPPAAPLVQGTESAAPVSPPGQTSDPAATLVLNVKPFRISNVCSYSEDACSLEAGVLNQGKGSTEAPASGSEVQSPTIKEESDPDDSTDTLVLVVPPDTTVTAQIFGSDSSSSTSSQEQPVSANLSSVSLSLTEGQVYFLTTAQPDSLSQVLPAKLSYILPATVNQATAGPFQPRVSGPRKPDVPYTTQWYRKRKMQNEKAGIHTRKYVRYTDIVKCKKCQKERKPPTHQQYYGNWYCEETATVPFADWMAKLSALGYGKKKTRK